MMRLTQKFIFIFLLVGISTDAFAHARLVAPVPRSNRDNNKSLLSPCGPDIKGTPVATYNQGQVIPVQWEETINHAGFYEFFISSDNDATFITVPNSKFIDNKNRGLWNETITLPTEVVCDNCTLRMIQFMNDDPNQPYQSCTDIRIVAAGAPPPPPPPPPPGDDQGSLDSASTSPVEKPGFGGCGSIDKNGGAGGGSAGSAYWVLFMLPLALLLLLRKHAISQTVRV